LVLNFFLIPSIGITGASFATFISYYVNIIIIFIITISYKLILFNLNSFFLLFLLLIFSLMILFFYESYILILIFCVFSLLALLFMYSSDINSLKNTALSKLRIYIRKK
jgi:O-antigen/teichoic acid export membrane protein